MRYFTADTHFFHEDLLGKNDFAPRLFKTVAAMHDTMIKNWNAVVRETDEVYLLGDVAMHPEHEAGFPEIFALLERLNGQIIFIKGNHDSRSFFNYLKRHDVNHKFSFADVGLILKFNHHQFFLTHYPMLLGITKNSINLHGHIHHAMLPIKENINVGVDAPEREFLKPALGFGTPISENLLLEIYEKKAVELEKLGKL